MHLKPGNIGHRRMAWLRRILSGGVLAVAGMAATAALAQSADLAAGGQALLHGDNVEAVRLLTRALDSGGLSQAERERAYLQRAQASLATGDAADALNDARKALVINPNDDVAATVRQKADIALNAGLPPVEDPSQAKAVAALNAKANSQIASENEATAKAYAAAMASYHETLTRYQADRKAEQDHYAAAQAAYQAKLKADEDKRKAALAAWSARAAACKKGDRSKCEAQ